MHTEKEARKKERFAVNLSDSELTTICIDSKASLAVPHSVQLITRRQHKLSKRGFSMLNLSTIHIAY